VEVIGVIDSLAVCVLREHFDGMIVMGWIEPKNVIENKYL
jgi:hypothetical protein